MITRRSSLNKKWKNKSRDLFINLSNPIKNNLKEDKRINNRTKHKLKLESKKTKKQMP